MSAGDEFQYRLRHATGGQRPGSHPASSWGAGHRFAGHARLFDVPDPRRIDLRASLRHVRREWLVRIHRQWAAVPVYAVVDVSASMNFGARHSKLQRVTEFVESMAYSAFRAGDPAGLMAFETAAGAELYIPARHSRGVGDRMSDGLRAITRHSLTDDARGAVSRARVPGTGLLQAVERLAGREALVFLVSDYHWPLDVLQAALECLTRCSVVPVVVWDRAEIEPPDESGLLTVRDAETQRMRSVWVDKKVRERWLEGVAQRRAAIETLFALHDIRPFYLIDAFDSAALSRYFLENYV